MADKIGMVEVTAACIYEGAVFSNRQLCLARDYDGQKFVPALMEERARAGIEDTGLHLLTDVTVTVRRYDMEVWSDG